MATISDAPEDVTAMNTMTITSTAPVTAKDGIQLSLQATSALFSNMLCKFHGVPNLLHQGKGGGTQQPAHDSQQPIISLQGYNHKFKMP